MSDAGEAFLDTAMREAAEAGGGFSVDLDGFEGPLHVLLTLAREQKVDLRRLSILRLAEQYLGFIAEARRKRIDLAADYLVMAAWLAFLKSRLLLPRRERATEESSPDDLAQHLAWRLRRLDAMREAADSLFQRPQTGLDVHPRGAPEDIAVTEIPLWSASLLDLLSAYSRQRTKRGARTHKVAPWPVWPIDEARRRLESALPEARDWQDLGRFAPPPDSFRSAPPSAASRYASLLSAGLELAKQGRLSMRQLEPMGPLYVRSGSGEETA